MATNQRERLINAMIDLVPLKGYPATTVADLIGRAGVSRKTFYALYPDRQALLTATFVEAAQALLQQAAFAVRHSGGPIRRLQALTRGLCGHAQERPGTVALTAFEIAAAQPHGLRLREDARRDLARLIQGCLDRDQATLPAQLAGALAGATLREIDGHLRKRRAHELDELALDLANWVRRYHPVPPGTGLLDLPPGSGSLGAPPDVEGLVPEPTGPWPWTGSDGLLGGRAPGTLMLTPHAFLARPARQARAYAAYANRERILDAVAHIAAAEGYEALTAEAIAERADVPERAFLAHFKGRDDAFAAALELGHAKGQAIVARARAGAPDWRTGVRAAVGALLEFLASEPCFTSLALVAAPLAGPSIALRCHEHAGAYAQLMLHGAPQRRRPPREAPRMVVQSLFELACAHVAAGRLAELPRAAGLAAYLTLAPFLGVTEAAAEAVDQP